MSKDFEGELFGLKVKMSEFVDEDTCYLFNPKNMTQVVKMENFKPYGRWHSIKYYFRTLLKAMRGKL